MTPEQIDIVDEAFAVLRKYYGNESECTSEAELKSCLELFDVTQKAFRSLLAEHASMSDRLRWRKQSEEPAPRGEVVLCRNPKFPVAIESVRGMYLVDTSEWRPL